MTHHLQAGGPEAVESDNLYDQRRLVSRVLRHWAEIAMARGLPSLRDVDPWMIGEDWANCLLAAVRSPVEHSYFVAVGQNLLPPSSLAFADAVVTLCPADTLAGILAANIAQVVSVRRCLIVEGAAAHRGAAVLYRGALLPLSNNGVDVDHVLGAANHRPLSFDEAVDPEPRLTWADGPSVTRGFGL